MRVSLIAPVFNEEAGIDHFFQRCTDVLAGLDDEFTFTFVNDGSKDKSLEKLLQIQKRSKYPVTIINLSRNFGHANALTAGIENADPKADAVIIMDADLEDPPELIPELLAEWKSGKDVVYTVKTRRDDRYWRKLAFHTFHFFFSKLTNLDIPEGSGSFCLMSRQFVTEFLRLQEGNRFIPGLRAYIGFTPGYVSYKKERRFAGIPKQTFNRLVDLSLNAFFLFSNAPVRTSSFLLVIAAILVGVSFFFPHVLFFQEHLLPMLLLLILFQLWIIGVATFKAQAETLKRPHYIVQHIYR